GMRRVVYTRTGDPGVLRLTDAPVPDPGPGEVRVRVHRSGVNPTDWKARRGPGPGQAVDPPRTPNHDGAGVVGAGGGRTPRQPRAAARARRGGGGGGGGGPAPPRRTPNHDGAGVVDAVGAG